MLNYEQKSGRAGRDEERNEAIIVRGRIVRTKKKKIKARSRENERE